DVGAWVDGEVGRLDVLPDPLLELTVLRGKRDVDIATLLRALARGPGTSEERARIEMAVLHELVTTDRVPIRQAVYWASRIAGDLSWDEYCAALQHEDHYDLAEAGHYGTVPEAERGFLEFLHRYA